MTGILSEHLPARPARNFGNAIKFQIPQLQSEQDSHSAHPYCMQLTHPYLVSGSADKSIRMWEVQSQRLVQGPLQAHEGSVLCLQVNRVDDAIVSGSTDGSFIVWRFSTGDIFKRVSKAHEDSILSLSLDSEYLITGGKDGKVKVWNHRNGTYDLMATVSGTTSSPVNALQYHSNSKTISSGSGSGMLTTWYLEGGNPTLLRETNMQGSGIACLGIACLDVDQSGRFIVTGHSYNGSIRFYDMHENRQIGEISGIHRGVVRSVVILSSNSNGPQRIASAGYDGSVRFFSHIGNERWIEDGFLDYGMAKEPDSEVERAYAVSVPGGDRVFSIAVDEERGRVYCSGQRKEIVGWQLLPSTD